MSIATISFLGDISLNDDYVDLAKKSINPFIKIEPILSKSDFVIGNLESLLTAKQGENLTKKPRLKTSIEAIQLLKSLHLNIATMAHNHIYDHYESGFHITKEELNKLNIQTVGAGTSTKEATKPILFSINTIKFGLLNYIHANTNPCLPVNANLSINYYDLDEIEKDIARIREESDFIIVYLHWGGLSDYCSYPYFNQQNEAHLMIDWGADLIVGSHTHTLQPYEIYKDKYIFYSLGNFCFSDLYFENKIIYQDGEKARETIIPTVTFHDDHSYKINISGLYNNSLYIEPSQKVVKRLSVHSVIQKNIFKYFIFWKLYFLAFKTFHKYVSYFFNDGITNKKSFTKQWKILIFKKTKKDNQ